MNCPRCKEPTENAKLCDECIAYEEAVYDRAFRRARADNPYWSPWQTYEQGLKESGIVHRR